MNYEKFIYITIVRIKKNAHSKNILTNCYSQFLTGQMKANHKAECSILATLKVKDFNMTENCLDLMCVLPIRVLNLKAWAS